MRTKSILADENAHSPSISPASRCMRVLRHPLFWILFLSLPFFMMGVRTLALSEEDAMYPQIAREMRQTRDWITPHLNGAPHLDKPPLLFWLIALSQRVFGETEAAARFWPAFACWLTIPVVGALGASLYGRRAGWLSALVFSGCLGPYIFSRVVIGDSMLCLWIALTVLAYSRVSVPSCTHGGFGLK